MRSWHMQSDASLLNRKSCLEFLKAKYRFVKVSASLSNKIFFQENALRNLNGRPAEFSPNPFQLM